MAEDMDNFLQSEIRITLPRHSGYTAGSKYTWTPKSPSTDSTTSLGQLHDKLNALPPLIYNKVPQKISATPELATVREVIENDVLSNTLPKRSRLGVLSHSHHKSIIKTNLSLAKKFTPCQNVSENKVSLGSKRVQGYQSENERKTPLVKRPPRVYQSDTEAETVVKRSKCISPENKEISPFMHLPTLGTCDESISNDTYDRLCKDNPQYDLRELLVDEALQNDKENDSGVCSKITEASDVVENTPIGKNVQRQKFYINRSTQTVASNSATDESTTDVIDDTPCYVYDRKKQKIGVQKRDKSTKKSSNVITEDVSAYAAAVDTFFSQHINENNGTMYINPTLAKKINETSSEGRDDDLANITILHEVTSCFEEVVHKEIVECLNSMVDKVCSDIDKCTVLMDEKHQHRDALSKVQHFAESSSDICKTENIFSRVDDFEKMSDTKKVTLKFNFSNKKRVPKMNKKQQKPKNVKQPIKVHEDNEIENADIKSPERATKPIMTRRKRKLYSPKDGDNDNNEITRTTLKDESRQSIINKTPLATCDKELEQAHRSRIRLPRKSRASSEQITSPKTKKLNDLFDKVKENVENEETVILVDMPKSRSRKDLAVYNLSSESEGQDFEEKTIKVQKRVSSSSLESSAKKRIRVVKPKQFSDLELCDFLSSEDESNMITKHKIVKQTKPRSRKVKKEQNLNLIDERMRKATAEVLETSFIKETVNAEIAEVVDPAIQKAYILENIPDDVSDVVTEDIVPENKSLTPKTIDIVNKEKVISRQNEKAETKARTPNSTFDIVKMKKEKAKSQIHDQAENKVQTSEISDIVKIKKEKATNKKKEKALKKSLVHKRGKVPNKLELNENISKGQDSATVSPLPGLVVETEQLRTDDNLSVSSIGANLLQKFKDVYNEVHDLSDTQTLILNEHNHNDADGAAGFTEQIETLEVSYSTERSIATVGLSPITAHNDLNEVPPNVELLHEEYQHRDVNTEGISRDMAEFLDTMRSQFICSSPVTIPVETSPVLTMSKTPSKRSLKKQNITSAESHTMDPVVVVKRLSTEEIERYLTPAKTRRSRTSQTSSTKVLSRNPSAEIEKYLSPRTKTSISTRSPQVVLDRLSLEDIDKWLPIPQLTCKGAINSKISKKPEKKETTKKLIGVTKTTTAHTTKVLSRNPSAEIEKYLSPRTKTSISTRSPQVVLDRLSLEDIDKWLPIPQLTCKGAINSKISKKPEKKETTKKLIGVTKTTTGKVQENKVKLIISPTSDKNHEQNLKSTISNIPDKCQENKYKSMISPVKLDFCLENTNRRLKRYNTRSSIKSTKSNATKVNKNKDEEIIHVSQKSSNTATTEKYVKENVQQKTQISVPSVDTTDILRKDKIQRLAASNVKTANSSDNSENTGRVQDWFRRNASASKGKAEAAAVKDIVAKVTEALETTLTEIHQSLREKLIHYYLENQKRFKAFKEDVSKGLDEMDKMLMEGANQVLRKDAEKKALMVRLLQEDIKAVIDFVAKDN